MGEPDGAPARGDAVLLARLRAGDDSALAVAYDDHGDVVFGIARRVTGNDDAAREITQDVFSQLWLHPERVDLERGTLRAYVAVVAHHRAVDQVRRVVRRDRAESRAATAAVTSAADDPELEVVAAAASRSRTGVLARVLDQLPQEQRRVIVLAYFEGCTSKEVASALGIPEGTAKSRLRLALARLRTALGPEGRMWA